ncbi:MAG: MBL fold metallo-hydrolase RNA specificity domain-containing protein [Clostridiaceae bacterium]
MKIRFYGAASSVTGSCHIFKVNGKNILLDCGLYQGKDSSENENNKFPFNAKEIDYVILSHAHIDHSGRIPLLYKEGFKGEVITTKPTMDLCSAMLQDSGHIQEMECQWENKKRIRMGLPQIEPLYTAKIAELSLYLFKGYDYEEMINLFPGLKVRFKNSGHLLGSAFVELFIKEDNKEEVKVVYSGDVGNTNIPILKDPEKIDYADYLILESTYGNRDHEKDEDSLEVLAKIIKDTFKRGGNVIIPSFAVGRTQEMIYKLKEELLKGKLEDLKVFIDSPLAIESTRIFGKYREDFDKDAEDMMTKGEDPLYFDGLFFSKSPEDSMSINKIQNGAIVISASGMCEAGRIKHHLKHNLWRKECSIIFVGYQAEGTLGRVIINGAKKVKILGEEVAINAQIHYLPGLSGHADRTGILNWVKAFKTKPKKIFLVHGDDDALKSLNQLLISYGFKSKIMKKGEEYFINEAGNYINTDTSVKNKILKLIDTLPDIDNMDKDQLLSKISEIIKN